MDRGSCQSEPDHGRARVGDRFVGHHAHDPSRNIIARIRGVEHQGCEVAELLPRNSALVDGKRDVEWPAKAEERGHHRLQRGPRAASFLGRYGCAEGEGSGRPSATAIAGEVAQACEARDAPIRRPADRVDPGAADDRDAPALGRAGAENRLSVVTDVETVDQSQLPDRRAKAPDVGRAVGTGQAEGSEPRDRPGCLGPAGVRGEAACDLGEIGEALRQPDGLVGNRGADDPGQQRSVGAHKGDVGLGVSTVDGEDRGNVDRDGAAHGPLRYSMMSSLKVAVIGGGSTYTPELVEGLGAEAAALPVDELVLHDIDEARLEIVGGLASRILRRQSWPGRLICTTDRLLALDGASFVLVQLRVGGQAARLSDETLPVQFGAIGQETVGAGGFAKALRTVPVVLDLASDVERLAAPDAWLVDFTNPVGIVTQALLDRGHRAIGLCNVAIGFQRRIAVHWGVDPPAVELDHVGLNHLTWIRGVRVEGRDVMDDLLADPSIAYGRAAFAPELLRRLRALPSYYLRYYLATNEVLAEQRAGHTRARDVAAIERDLLGLYADPTLDRSPEPPRPARWCLVLRRRDRVDGLTARRHWRPPGRQRPQ